MRQEASRRNNLVTYLYSAGATDGWPGGLSQLSDWLTDICNRRQGGCVQANARSGDETTSKQIAQPRSSKDRSPVIAEFCANLELTANDVSVLAFQVNATG